MKAQNTHTASRPLKRDILQRAAQVCGTLSKPSKMPCYGFSLPAQRCQTGGRLQNVENSTCFKCYALRGNYRRGNVREALEARYDKLMQATEAETLEQWADAMADQINAQEKSGFFRWHDSGDIQSVAHLLAIFRVCELTPSIKHWIPTREAAYVREALELRPKPSNLVIRLSALKRGFPPSAGLANRLNVQTSTVSWSDSGVTCEANKRGGVCGECRACWSESVFNVDYPLH
jgi:hypothetical protein